MSAVEALILWQGSKWNQAIKGADQEIKANSEGLISTNQQVFSDTEEAWLHFFSL